jgi:hypothetical protein
MKFYPLSVFFFYLLFCPLCNGTSNKKLQLNIDSSSDYLCYYGYWDDDKISRGQDFDLIILEPSGITAAQISKLKKGHDGISGTNDDVIVIGYLSIGEDHSASRTGNGKGPCYFNYDSNKVIYENMGLASWYVDDNDLNQKPDTDPIWKSAYVNAGDTLWWQFLKTNSNGADVILNIKNCDGLFLDLVDIAMPWAPWPYRWTLLGMTDLISWLRNTYQDKYLIANRGLFYFDPSVPEAYSHSIRPYIDADMFESYYIENNRTYWAQKLNTEGSKPDGFKVIALDYFQPSDTISISKQTKEVFSYNWTDYISNMSLDQIRYDVFHRHAVDKNPPTWDNQYALIYAAPGDGSVKLSWGALTDQSLPLKFDVYYSNADTLDILTAQKLSNITPGFDSSTLIYSFEVNNLVNDSKYYFLVRVKDALDNSEYNNKVLSATPRITSIDNGKKSANDFQLFQNYPNPFNPITRIQYNMPKADNVKLNIYNSLGVKVRTLTESYQNAGMHSVIWDGKDSKNKSVSSGVYFFRLETGNISLMKKMILIK